MGAFYPFPTAHGRGANLADRYLEHLWHANNADNDIGGMPDDELAEMYLRVAGVAAWVGAMALSPSRAVLLGVDIITAQDTISQASEAVLDEILSRGEVMQPPVHELMKLVLDRHPGFGVPEFLEKSGLVVPSHLEATQIPRPTAVG